MTDDTHRMLADAAAAFAKPDAARVRKWRAIAPGFDRAVWEQMADQGWLSLLVPEDDWNSAAIARASLKSDRSNSSFMRASGHGTTSSSSGSSR